MRKMFYFMFLSALFFLSCGYGKIYNSELYYLDAKNEVRNLPLNLQVNENTYKKFYYSGNFASQFIKTDNFVYIGVDDGHLPLQESDAIELSQRELNNFFNIHTQNSDMNVGTVVCRMVSRKFSTNELWILASALTLWTASFIGFPFQSITVEVEMELEIFNADNNSIKKYASKGKSTKHLSFLNIDCDIGAGDNDNTSRRDTNSKAIIKALENLTQKINKDTPQLIKMLL